MAILGTTPLLEKKPGAASATAKAAQTDGWKPSAIVADIATLGTGTLLSVLCSVALVFVVPKLLSVEDFGYWRLFGLYAGYVGFLHFGFADGALLRWAGRPLGEFHTEIGTAIKYLFWQHVIVLVPLCASAVLLLPGQIRFLGIATAIFALIFNLVTLLQFGLQSAKLFRPVAVSGVAAPALFLGFILLWRWKWQSDYREVIGFCATGWLVVLIFLLAWAKPWGGAPSRTSVKALASECVSNGLPILMANGGMLLIMYSDRLAVSWAATIQNFAQYSMAASAMTVPITAIQACSKVFFSHLAGVTTEGRRRIYGISSRTLLLVWAFLLPYYFVLDVVVRRFLPRYAPSLPYARVLLLAIPFLGVIQILQMSCAYLNGMQRHFLGRTVAVLVVSLGATSYAAFHSGSLRMVAGVQVAIMGGWWLFNEWTMWDLTGQGKGDWTKFVVIFVAAGADYWVATELGWQTPGLILAYYLCLAIVLAAFCRDELFFWRQLLRRGGLGRQARAGGAE